MLTARLFDEGVKAGRIQFLHGLTGYIYESQDDCLIAELKSKNSRGDGDKEISHLKIDLSKGLVSRLGKDPRTKI